MYAEDEEKCLYPLNAQEKYEYVQLDGLCLFSFTTHEYTTYTHSRHEHYSQRYTSHIII